MEVTSLNPAGWFVMLASVGSVLTLMSYCVGKVLLLPPLDVEEHLRGPLEIETPDVYDRP